MDGEYELIQVWRNVAMLIIACGFYMLENVVVRRRCRLIGLLVYVKAIHQPRSVMNSFALSSIIEEGFGRYLH